MQWHLWKHQCTSNSPVTCINAYCYDNAETDLCFDQQTVVPYRQWPTFKYTQSTMKTNPLASILVLLCSFLCKCFTIKIDCSWLAFACSSVTINEDFLISFHRHFFDVQAWLPVLKYGVHFQIYFRYNHNYSENLRKPNWWFAFDTGQHNWDFGQNCNAGTRKRWFRLSFRTRGIFLCRSLHPNLLLLRFGRQSVSTGN